MIDFCIKNLIYLRNIALVTEAEKKMKWDLTNVLEREPRKLAGSYSTDTFRAEDSKQADEKTEYRRNVEEIEHDYSPCPDSGD